VTEEFGWGVSLSGSYATPNFDERDKLLFQVNRGNGIGRYVNDLSSIGNYDGIFDPATGDLQLFDVTAGYASWQHWWDIEQLRSNFTFGVVDVNNPGFLAGDAYQRTLRFSSNLIWSPISRIDIGGEYLWGSRENEDGENGDANQLQFAVKYRF
jgi:DcaP outer membrane protein